MNIFKKASAALLLAAMVAVPTTAQPDERPDDRDHSKRTERRAAQMAERMKLDDETTAWFKPIYMAYTDSLEAVNRPAEADKKDKKDKKKKDREEKAEERKPLTQEQADKIIGERFDKSEREVAVKRHFHAIFRERLTPDQQMMVFAAPAPERNRSQQQGGFPQRGPQGGPQGGFGGGFGGPGGGF